MDNFLCLVCLSLNEEFIECSGVPGARYFTPELKRMYWYIRENKFKNPEEQTDEFRSSLSLGITDDEGITVLFENEGKNKGNVPCLDAVWVRESSTWQHRKLAQSLRDAWCLGATKGSRRKKISSNCRKNFICEAKCHKLCRK